MPEPHENAWLRPMVRYVDAEQAVIDVQVIHPKAHHAPIHEVKGLDTLVELWMQITGSDGFVDEHRTPMRLQDGTGSARFEVVEPQRWWPAGMGDQSLYELTLSLVGARDEVLERRSATIGLTSVRADNTDDDVDAPRLLVNGEICEVRTVLPVDRIDERALLPATGDSLLLVRDHYGPDVLYRAADRAGILLVQCVPIHPEGYPEVGVGAQVDRLSEHPSLAGWFVGHLGRISDDVADRLRKLDPTRSVFRRFPVEPAA